MESLTSSIASLSLDKPVQTKKRIVRKSALVKPVVYGVTVLGPHDDYLWTTDKEGTFAIRCSKELHPSGFFLVTPTRV